jgi:hypothetical protein
MDYWFSAVSGSECGGMDIRVGSGDNETIPTHMFLPCMHLMCAKGFESNKVFTQQFQPKQKDQAPVVARTA